MHASSSSSHQLVYNSNHSNPINLIQEQVHATIQAGEITACWQTLITPTMHLLTPTCPIAGILTDPGGNHGLVPLFQIVLTTLATVLVITHLIS